MTQLRAVVFDLDGTLVDTWDVHASCLRKVTTDLGDGPSSLVHLFRAQRPTDIGTLGALVGPERAESALLSYGAALRELLRAISPRPVGGAVEAVNELRRTGVAVGVCTGRSREDAQALLDASGLAVSLTVTREDAPPKPEPDALLLALRGLAVSPHEALFVGDSEWDRQQGQAAGVRTLVVRRERLSVELLTTFWATAGVHEAGTATPAASPDRSESEEVRHD
ncbi:HAD family hydrolase [Streptomyces sp. NPDC005283]|uniref:HAD family hydrolase n=1 Tax=Streptomyces sp. NPDC005283 TaxID=3156871 RepID=UPI003456E099